jgi:hypothetical protein
VRGEGRGWREGEVEVEVEERKREGLRKHAKPKAFFYFRRRTERNPKA